MAPIGGASGLDSWRKAAEYAASLNAQSGSANPFGSNGANPTRFAGGVDGASGAGAGTSGVQGGSNPFGVGQVGRTQGVGQAGGVNELYAGINSRGPLESGTDGEQFARRFGQMGVAGSQLNVVG